MQKVSAITKYTSTNNSDYSFFMFHINKKTQNIYRCFKVKAKILLNMYSSTDKGIVRYEYSANYKIENESQDFILIHVKVHIKSPNVFDLVKCLGYRNSQEVIHFSQNKIARNTPPPKITKFD